MGAPTSTHPTDQTLSDYGLGKLGGASAESVDAHLEGCAACRRRALEMNPDSFLGRFRDGRSFGGPPAGLGGPTTTRSPAEVGTPIEAGTLPPGLADHKDYRVVRELGRGGMGVVYLAENTLMGRMEVLKVMAREMTERPEVLERFLREIRAVARLRHPNIVAAYHAFRIDKILVFAMEHVDGYDLSKMVKARGPLAVAHACLFTQQAALGLQHAHEEGMIHRDIKPGNLMVARRGEKAVVKVLDFGLAKAAREGEFDGALTHAGQMLGTPDYMAPEQIVDAQAADIRADIYSLGCTLYYLLSGGPPFRGSSLYDLFQAHHSMDAKLLNFVRPEVPAELAALVAKMMAKEPERRFRTPAEVAAALAPFTRKGGVSPRPGLTDVSRVAAPSPRPTPPVAVRTPKTDLAPHESAAEPRKLVATESTVIDSRAPEPKTEAPAPEPERDRPRRPWPWIVAASGRAAAVVLGIVLYIKTNKGLLKIETDDPKATFQVIGEGKPIRVEGLGEPISIQVGDYDLIVKRGDVVVKTQDFQIQRGKDTVLKVEVLTPQEKMMEAMARAMNQGPSMMGMPGAGTSQPAGAMPGMMMGPMMMGTPGAGGETQPKAGEAPAGPGMGGMMPGAMTGMGMAGPAARAEPAAPMMGMGMAQPGAAGLGMGMAGIAGAGDEAQSKMMGGTGRMMVMPGMEMGQSARMGGPGMGMMGMPGLGVPGEPDLIAFYDFDDATATDRSGHGHHGTLSANPPTFTPDGHEKGALSFDPGRKNSIDVPVDINPSPIPQITMGGWFKARSADSPRVMLSNTNGGYDRRLGIHSRKNIGHQWSTATGQALFPGGPVKVNQWTFVAMRHDQATSTLVFDVDGRQFTTKAYFGAGGEHLRIGKHPVHGEYFDGVMDNIFIYKGFLSDAKIADIRARGRAAILPPSGPASKNEGGSPTSRATEDDARRSWSCSFATFEAIEPGRWREINDSHRRIFYYQESGRTKQHVELSDPDRGQVGLWVRLGDGRGEISSDLQKGWAKLDDGRWRSATAPAGQITTEEAARKLEEDVRKFRDPGQVDARGVAFKDIADKLFADFETRVTAFRAETTGGATALKAWSETVRESRIFRPDPGDRTRIRADPDFGRRAREVRKQLGEASYDVEMLLRVTAGAGRSTARMDRPTPDPAGKPPAPPAGPVPLFNGKDLTGWTDLLRNGSEWKVVGGILEGHGSGTVGKPGVLVLQRQDLKDFRLRAKVRHRAGNIPWIEVRRASRDGAVNGYAVAAGIWPNNQGAPVGSVVRLKDYRYGGPHHLTLVAAKTGVATDEWHDLTIDLHQNTITTLLDGKRVGEYTDPEGSLPSGGVALLCPGNTRAEYRSITLEESPDRGDRASSPARTGAQGWAPLFNGKDLADFDIGWADQHRWSVVDGSIVSAEPGTRTVLHTKRHYSDFHLRFETMPAEGSAGSIDFRWKGPELAPSFYAISIAGSVAGPGPQKTGNIQHWTAGKRADVASASDPPAPLAPGRWFPMEIIAVGDTIRVLVEGREVARYKDPERTLTSGPIGLFCRPNATMRFRNLLIKELTANSGG